MKKYLLTAATAFALGAGTVQLADLDARAAVVEIKGDTVSFVLGTAAKTTLENFLQAKVCPQIDGQYGLSGALACDVSRDVRNVCFFWNDADSPGQVTARARVETVGSWVPGAAQ